MDAHRPKPSHPSNPRRTRTLVEGVLGRGELHAAAGAKEALGVERVGRGAAGARATAADEAAVEAKEVRDERGADLVHGVDEGEDALDRVAVAAADGALQQLEHARPLAAQADVGGARAGGARPREPRACTRGANGRRAQRFRAATHPQSMATSAMDT